MYHESSIKNEKFEGKSTTIMIFIDFCYNKFRVSVSLRSTLVTNYSAEHDKNGGSELQFIGLYNKK
jgi:hypothetical protein